MWGNSGVIMSKTQSTSYKGIRYREHISRKNGIKPDKYFFIRYRHNGKLREEGWGWESEGFSAKDAFIVREEIMRAIKTGEEIATLAERRSDAERKRNERTKAEELDKLTNISFGQFFNETYAPNKTRRVLTTESALFKYWIEPIIGAKTFPSITELDLERIKKKVVEKNRSLRTVEYCFAVIRQVFTEAGRHGIYKGDHPVSKAVRKRIKFDNRRTRSLNADEARDLLDALMAKSRQVHDMAVLSLYCGLRAGEVFSLDWSDINLNDQTITLRDTKNSKTRIVKMPIQVLKMFAGYTPDRGNIAVFANSKGGRIVQISKTFGRAVDALGLNKNINDSRQMVTFHTLRHTYASWLASEGVPLYTIQKLLGHSSMQMTERYSHLSPGNLNQAADILSAMEKSNQQKLIEVNFQTG